MVSITAMAEKPSLPPPKPLTPQDWETLIDDFQSGSARRHKWTALYPVPSLLDLLLSSLLRKDVPFSLKLQLLVFLEELSDFFFTQEIHFLDRLIDALRVILQAPVDGIHINFAFKEQMMVSTTSILISVEAFENSHARYLEILVELLLNVVNRPNFEPDRQTRAIACECLRELERSYPCLLADIVGHLWSVLLL